MKRGVIGAVSGLVIGVAIGASVVAPRLNGDDIPLLRPAPSLKLGDGIELLAPPSEPVRVQPLQKTEHAAPPKPATKAEAKPPAQSDTKTTKSMRPTVTWRVESAFTANEPAAARQAARIAEIMQHTSAGTHSMKVFGPGQIVAPDDLLNAVASGTLEAAFATPELWAERIPALTLFAALPFGPAPDEHLAWFFGGNGKTIYETAYDTVGLKGMLCGLAPTPSSGWFRQVLGGTDAFDGLRIHVQGTAARVLARLGAETYNLDAATALDGLRSGSLDGAVFSSPRTDLALGAHKAATHYYFPGWQQPTRFLDLIINKTAWKKLTPEQRARLETACGDNLREGLATASAGQFTALMEMAEAGVEVHRWPEDVLAELRRAWADVRAELAQTAPAFGAGWDSLKRFREDQAIWQELARP